MANQGSFSNKVAALLLIALLLFMTVPASAFTLTKQTTHTTTAGVGALNKKLSPITPIIPTKLIEKNLNEKKQKELKQLKDKKSTKEQKGGEKTPNNGRVYKDSRNLGQQVTLAELQNCDIVNFEDASIGTELSTRYANEPGVTFVRTETTRPILVNNYNRGGDATASGTNNLHNDAVHPESSRNQPLEFVYKEPQTVIGWNFGNGNKYGWTVNAELRGYDANGNIVARATYNNVPREITAFQAIYSATPMVRAELDYGDTLLSEDVDDVLVNCEYINAPTEGNNTQTNTTTPELVPTLISISINNQAIGDAYTLQPGRVTVSAAVSPANAGELTLYVDGHEEDQGNTATADYIFNTGTHTITASFPGNSQYASSSRTTTINVEMPSQTDTEAPIVTFTNPTPATGTVLPNDESTFTITSNEPLTSATLELTDATGTINNVPLEATSTTTFTKHVTDLLNATNTYRVRAVDTAGNTGYSETRTLQVPIAYPLWSFMGSASTGPHPTSGIGTMINYNGALYVGTYDITNPGQGKVYKSTDGVNFQQVFPTATMAGEQIHGVYSTAILNNELYVGTGGNNNGDGKLFKTADGTTWTEVFGDHAYQFGFNKVNTLTTINGQLIAGISRDQGTAGLRGYICEFQTATNFNCNKISIDSMPIISITQLNGKTYALGYGSPDGIYLSGAIYEKQTDGTYQQISTLNNIVYSITGYNGKLYVAADQEAGFNNGVPFSNRNPLLSSVDGINWAREEALGMNRAYKFYTENDHLYVNGLGTGRSDAKSVRRNGIPGFTLYTAIAASDVLTDMVSWNGHKYVVSNDRRGNSQVYKITAG